MTHKKEACLWRPSSWSASWNILVLQCPIPFPPLHTGMGEQGGQPKRTFLCTWLSFQTSREAKKQAGILSFHHHSWRAVPVHASMAILNCSSGEKEVICVHGAHARFGRFWHLEPFGSMSMHTVRAEPSRLHLSKLLLRLLANSVRHYGIHFHLTSNEQILFATMVLES